MELEWSLKLTTNHIRRQAMRAYHLYRGSIAMSEDYLDQVVSELKAKESREQTEAKKEECEHDIKKASGPKVFQDLRKWLKSTTDGLNQKMGRGNHRIHRFRYYPAIAERRHGVDGE